MKIPETYKPSELDLVKLADSMRRFIRATGMRKSDFARAVGMTASELRVVLEAREGMRAKVYNKALQAVALHRSLELLANDK